MDIERYNFADIVFRKFRMGILRQEIQAAENTRLLTKRTKYEHAYSEQVLGDKVDEQSIAEVEEETGYIGGAYATGIGPDGALLRRNNSDAMNNFFVNICVRAFTNIESTMQDARNNENGKRFEKFKKVLDSK